MYKIKRCTIYSEAKKGKWECYLINPNIPYDDYLKISNGVRFIKGGSFEIVERKVIKQLQEWEKTKESDLKAIEDWEECHRLYVESLNNNSNEDDLPF